MISRYAAVAAIVIIYVALRLPGIDVPLDRDEGAFGHMGQMIAQGGMPYRDGLDHKPPVAFYINALALKFVPPTARGIHSFLLIYNFLTLVCLCFAARAYFDSVSAGLWCAFCYAVVSATPSLQGFTASTEMWALLPISASLVAAVAAIRKDAPVLAALSGAAGALACWTKQTMVTSIVFVAMYVILASGRARIRALILWLTGASAVSAAMVVYFFAHGLLREFWYWCFTYGVVYAQQVSFSENAEDLRSALADVGLENSIIAGVGIGAALWTLASGWRRKQDSAEAPSPRETWPIFVLGFLILSLAGTIPGFAYAHYFAQLAPPLALAGGQGFRMISDRVRGRRARVFVTVACAAAVLASPIFFGRDYFLERDPNVISRDYFGDNPFPESKPVADYVAARTAADDRVLIVGSEPQILFYAKRRSPSAFLMMYPLTSVHARYLEFQRQLIADVKAHPPAFIVEMVHIPTSLTPDEDADPQALRFLSELIGRDYTLERVRLVGGPDGEWVNANDARLSGDTPFINVFRRRR